ncbi:MAG TPA: type II toxin-antitoxin system PemK/MazF family toxin [Ignavibacteria bacterium]|nr:type II toxin-antitoxin system PemK/MazF family toxin [Ignavibacteria bacterium]
MIKGEIVLAEFPYTDYRGSKSRPVLILAEKKVDVLGAFITSNLENMDDDDLLLKADNQNKLKKNSRIRLFRLATIKKNKILGTIGFIDEMILKKIDGKLVQILKINI